MPTRSRRAEIEKINGHNRNAIKSIRKPVNIDKIAIDKSIRNDNI
jgi:hypothetical protein